MKLRPWIVIFFVMYFAAVSAKSPYGISKQTNLVALISDTETDLEHYLKNDIKYFVLNEENPEITDKLKSLAQREGISHLYVIFTDIFTFNSSENRRFITIDKLLKIENNELKYYDEDFSLILYISSGNVESDKDACIKFWKQSGRRPNFLLVNNDINKARQTKDHLLSIRKIKSTVLDQNNYPVDNIRWGEYPELVTKGEFSLPYEPSVKLILSPYKYGYRFSPDIMYFNNKTYKKKKVFRAYKLDIQDDMIGYFDFNENTRNKCFADITRSINHNIEFEDDDELGVVANFNGKSSFVDCSKNFELDNEITISAWIKPKKLDDVICIVGKGREFNLKLAYGMLTFTQPEIKDYKADFDGFNINEWYHIVVTYFGGRELNFYVNGARVDNHKIDTKIEPTDFSLLIGNNLWDEYFNGDIDDVLLWKRVLNDSEIKEIHNKKPVLEAKSYSTLIVYMVSAGVIIALLVIIFFRKRKEIPVLPSKKEIIKIPEFKQEFTEKFNIFGSFYMSNSNGDDITAKFSPMLKKLYLVFLFHSVERDGITSQRLTEILWPDYTFKSAKNTRGTNIQKLRNLLSGNEGISIDFVDKRWFLNFDDDKIYCDYKKFYELLNRAKTDFNIENILIVLPELLTITNKGRIVINVQDEWLDPYLEDITNAVLEFYVSVINVLNYDQHTSILQNIADAIFKFDSVNETALEVKIKALNLKGQHGTAKLCFDHFKNEYFALYDEDYPKSFGQFG